MDSNTVLVVDDDAAVRCLIAVLLKSEGLTVIQAGNGAAALAALRDPESSIQVVVSDILMRGIDGVSLFEAASEEFQDLPFVFMTGHPDNERVLSLPTNYPVITKPFVPEALLTCIRHVLKKQ